jgi:hypothetical protein
MSARILPPTLFALLLAGSVTAQPPAPAPPPPPPPPPPPMLDVVYPQMCEASAAVALGSGMFVVADDDKKELRIYRTDQPAGPEILDISKIPGLDKKADLKGAARIGDEIYWIGSHSRNNAGLERPERHRLFAIKIRSDNGRHSFEAVGTPYTTLLKDLREDGGFVKFGLDEAAKLKPEEPGGLNIEGLAATPDGKLLIGFRSPVRNGKALIVTLDNPQAVLTGAKATFGAPIELDLGGRGIRSLERLPAGDSYVITAGLSGSGTDFQAFRWSGKANGAPEPLAGADLTGLVPEAVFVDGIATGLVVLSDDGDTCPADPAFRGRRVSLSSAARGRSAPGDDR